MTEDSGRAMRLQQARSYLRNADPVLARLPAKPSWQVGVEDRDIPDGYEAALAGSVPSLTDPAVARLYAQMTVAARDPVWSWRRLRRLFAINFGRAPGGTR